MFNRHLKARIAELEMERDELISECRRLEDKITRETWVTTVKASVEERRKRSQLKTFDGLAVSPASVIAVAAPSGSCGDGVLVLRPRDDAEVVIDINNASAHALVKYFEEAETNG